MQTCRLLHYGTGVDVQRNGFIIDGKAYIKGGADELKWANEYKDIGAPCAHIVVDGKHYFSPNLFNPFDTECENHLIQLEIYGKWGYADTTTGEIVIPPVWDWCSPFYNEFALVLTGCVSKPGEPKPHYEKEPGKPQEIIKGVRCGYINTRGEVVVPLIYMDADPIANDGLFIVRPPDELFGVIDVSGKTIIGFDWLEMEYRYTKDIPSGGFIARSNPEKRGEYTVFSTSGEIIKRKG